MNGRHRVLIHSDRPQIFIDKIAGLLQPKDVACCRTYAGAAEAMNAARPEIVLSHKFEKEPYPGRAIVDCESVRWVHCGGTGTDHFAPWDAHRVTVTNSAGAPRISMSEYVIGAIYAFNQGIPHYMRLQREHRWERGTVRATEGGTIVVIGLGRIGRAICARAKAVGLNVIGIRSRPDPVPEADEVMPPDRLEEALGRADYVAVIVPRTPGTAHLLDEQAIQAIKPGSVVINISRGGVVDDDALAAALRSGHVRGAVLDVFETEPLPPDHPLWDFENVVVTPHVAGFCEGWEEVVAEIFRDNLERWIDERPLVNVVDPAQGY